MASPEQSAEWPFRPGKNIEKLTQSAERIKTGSPEPITWREAIAAALVNKATGELQTQLYPGLFFKSAEARMIAGYRAAASGGLTEPFESLDLPGNIRIELLADVVDSSGKATVLRPFDDKSHALDAIDQVIEEHGFTTGNTPGSREARKDLEAEFPDETELEVVRTLQEVWSDSNFAVIEGVNRSALDYHTKHLDPNSQKDLAWQVKIYMWNTRDSNPDVPQRVLDATGRPTLVGRIMAVHDYHAIKDRLQEKGLIPQAA